MNNNKTTRCESMRKHDNSGETGEKGSEQLVTASEASRAIRKVWMNSYMAPKNPSREELRRDNDARVCVGLPGLDMGFQLHQNDTRLSVASVNADHRGRRCFAIINSRLDDPTQIECDR
jgi:hypothetical protein